MGTVANPYRRVVREAQSMLGPGLRSHTSTPPPRAPHRDGPIVASDWFIIEPIRPACISVLVPEQAGSKLRGRMPQEEETVARLRRAKPLEEQLLQSKNCAASAKHVPCKRRLEALCYELYPRRCHSS